MELTRMFVEVPMRVQTPPKRAPKEKGMRSFVELTLSSWESPRTIVAWEWVRASGEWAMPAER
jgi:hypothetical protein